MPTFSNLDSMPESHIEDDRHMSAVLRVQAVDPNRGRCLVENCSPNRSVEYCHVVPQKFWKDEGLLNSLEWHWGMRNNTLNPETRWNIFPAGSSVCHMYDAGQWILVPEDSIVQTYHDATEGLLADRETFPLIPNRNNFQYRLLPLKDMDDIVLIRQNDTTTPLAPGAFTAHVHPFSTLPTLVSHVHPKFVIFSAGSQLFQMWSKWEPDFNALSETYPIVTRILLLFLAWHQPVPDDAESEPTYFPPYDPHTDNEDDNERNGGGGPKDKDYDGAVTEKGRYVRSSRKRPRHESPTPNHSQTNPVGHHDPADSETSGDLSPASKQRKPSYLSHVSLSDHTGRTGKMEWNKGALINWSSNCPPPSHTGMADLSGG